MKTLYLYWGGRGLSWLRFLTVKSFAKHNPDWEIKVYYPTNPTKGDSWSSNEQKVAYTGTDYFDKLKEHATLVPLDMETIGFSNYLPEVHKSDIFRTWVLPEYGGLYSDFDILYVKPMPEIKERLFCHHPDGHYANGLLGAPKGDELFQKILDKARSITSPKYQAYGPALWEDYLTQTPEGFNIPKNFIYSCEWYNAESLFTESMEIPEEAIGLHWFGGSESSGQWENKDISPESTIGKLVKPYV